MADEIVINTAEFKAAVDALKKASADAKAAAHEAERARSRPTAPAAGARPSFGGGGGGARGFGRLGGGLGGVGRLAGGAGAAVGVLHFLQESKHNPNMLADALTGAGDAAGDVVDAVRGLIGAKTRAHINAEIHRALSAAAAERMFTDNEARLRGDPAFREFAAGQAQREYRFSDEAKRLAARAAAEGARL